ncbi:MAG: preprotein translocase subunit SecG [Candidatus Omnitrophica bacterium]|nr:preprotein translocase subunit SecG [Candidatus Omnitrophota bacterium]
MTAFIIAVHVIACVLLLVIILIQAGRGGGLVDSFSSVESMFGTKTNALLTRATSILSVVFFLTCLSLALLSARQNRSLMRTIEAEQPAAAAEAGVLDTQAHPADSVAVDTAQEPVQQQPQPQ